MSGRTYTGFDDGKIAELKEAFDSWDSIEKDNKLDPNELAKAMEKLGNFNLNQLKDIMERSDLDGNGTIDFDEFLVACWEKRSCLRDMAERESELIRLKGIGSVMHSFSQEEMSAFAEHMNYVLGDDKDLAYLFPIRTTGLDLCFKIADGCMLSKFINLAVPDTIDYRVVNKPKKRNGYKMSVFQMNENNSLMINAAKSIGVNTINIGAGDLREGMGKPHLVLGMIWQLVKIQLLNQINLKNHPELIRLLNEDETLEQLLALPAEQLLLRWFNFHLREAGHKRRVKNFGKDVADGQCYTVLLNHLNPKKCTLDPLDEKDNLKRADMVVRNAEALGAKVFIAPKDIVDRNERLNLAFTASIFNHCPGLIPITDEEEKELTGMMEDDVGDTREERAFRMWINTLGIDKLYINNLFEDCKDGLVLLKVIDKIEPGLVCWSKVEKKPKNKFKKVSNCNYAVVLSKYLKLSLVTTGGADIVAGRKKLVLGLVWQLMRYHSIKFLSQLSKDKGKQISDKDILSFCNKMAKNSEKTKMRLRSFGDKSKLKNGKYFIYVLGGVFLNVVDWDLMTDGDNLDDALLNARYALSVARKEGCTIFLLPEDIVEANPRMCMTFGAAIMTQHAKRTS